MAVETFPSAAERPFFDRIVHLRRLNWELTAYIVLITLSIIAHLWQLDKMAMHHDEGVHAWTTYKIYTGSGGFTCAGSLGFGENGLTYTPGPSSNVYCYDPVYHGPSLYYTTLVSYFLFGDGDWQARLPMAVAGVLLVASAWMLRPYLGRRGALLAAILFAFTPALLYYTRFARHDALMVLWTFWLVLGIWRYIDSGRAGWLYLAAVGLALMIATHELYYLLFAVYGSYLLTRILIETVNKRWVLTGMGSLLLLGALLALTDPTIAGIDMGEKGLLAALILTMPLLAALAWDERPFVMPRLSEDWRNRRWVLLTALIIFAIIYVLLYSSFFAYPLGILTGLYAGFGYWLSAHGIERIFQPWYYYLMMLPIYEPLIVVSALGVPFTLLIQRLRALRAARGTAQEETLQSSNSADGVGDGAPGETAEAATPVPITRAAGRLGAEHHFILFVCAWFFGALIAFSWAGEKVPWLLVHITLPGNILVAWAISRLLLVLDGKPFWKSRLALVIPATLLFLVAFGTMAWRVGQARGGELSQQTELLRAFLPLLVIGGLIYFLLSTARLQSWGRVLATAGLALSALLGVYTLRSTWQAVYAHPDTPIEILVYTQTAPNVPLMMDEINQLAVAVTRNQRSDTDVAGGRSMPVIMDIGDRDAGGEGNLAWPFEWYLRDFTAVNRQDAAFFRDATPGSFTVTLPGGQSGPAPVVLVSKQHVSEAGRIALEEEYVLRYDTVFNWWFPEDSSNSYKAFSNPDDWPKLLAWPLQPENWPVIRDYLLFRELPAPLRPGAREMQMWVRKDLLAGAGDVSGTSAQTPPDTFKLLPQAIYGELQEGPAEDRLLEPREVVVDAEGNLYVTDTFNHRVVVFGPDGSRLRSIGSYGSGPNQFNEPRGIAIDGQGNLYVADTWNARVVKLSNNGQFVSAWGSGTPVFGEGDPRVATITGATAEGNAANPLGFFGPRGVAVDSQNRVYIADTGNRRVVVTDDQGNFLYQFGYEGGGNGEFREPVALALDAAGNLYVADVWNGRVQAFAPAADGILSPQPYAVWRVAGWLNNSYDDPSIAVNDDGSTIVVSIPSRHIMASYDGNGLPLLRWGGLGNDSSSFNFPSGASFGPDSLLYVVDRVNGRVLSFQLP